MGGGTVLKERALTRCTGLAIITFIPAGKACYVFGASRVLKTWDSPMHRHLESKGYDFNRRDTCRCGCALLDSPIDHILGVIWALDWAVIWPRSARHSTSLQGLSV